MSLLFAAALAASAPLALPAEGDPVDVVDAAARERGDRSQVLVLGTSHLSGLPKEFDLNRFDALLDELEQWAPEAIAIENLSGPQCDYLKEYEHRYSGTWETYCTDPSPARAALGLTAAEADREIAELLAETGKDRSAGERRRLAVLFIAIGEPDSALVQWLRLPASERHADSVLTGELAAFLEKRTRRRNESSLIAAHLAARLGHERVYPVDDHTGDDASGPVDYDVYGPALRKIWDNPASAKVGERFDQWEERLAKGELSVIDWYLLMNSPEHSRLTMQSDFGAAAGSRSPSGTGRQYLAYWETRNLRMVANLRHVIGPGRRVLAIVGASHKPYYERYLGMTSDVELVPVDAVLADPAQ